VGPLPDAEAVGRWPQVNPKINFGCSQQNQRTENANHSRWNENWDEWNRTFRMNRVTKKR
jgi:hypothetical protein